MKGSWKKKGIEGNPFSLGSCAKNCSHVLCGPTPPSQLEPRARATRDHQEIFSRSQKLAGKNQEKTYHTNRTDQALYADVEVRNLMFFASSFFILHLFIDYLALKF
jgi:hypothetical protein